MDSRQWLTRDSDDAETVAPFTMPEPDAPAVLGYTSGTTGRAKGALLLQRNLLANIKAITQAWRWTEDDHLLLTLPLFHAHGLMVGMHGTLLAGASVVLRRKFDAATFSHNDQRRPDDHHVLRRADNVRAAAGRG